jgi:hypothetical protein
VPSFDTISRTTGAQRASCCRSIAFFCSEAELQQWLSAQSPQPTGYRFTLDEALEVGRALFEPVLAAAKLNAEAHVAS